MDTTIRPWGCYEVLFDAEYCKVKRIVISPKQRLSYQYHKHRQEAWTVVQGVVTVTQNDVVTTYKTGDTVIIYLGDKHRMANLSEEESVILIEVQTGTYFGEDDIVRIEDDYDRVW